MKKPTLIVAGPGAGKTHDMVNRIKSAIPVLSRFRSLAVITYTNTATDSIRGKLALSIDIPENVFVGTIHSFLNRFIIQPYATIFGFLPSKRTFLSIDVEQKIQEILRKEGVRIKDGDVAKRRPSYVNTLLKKGVVPIDEMANLSLKLLEIPTILKRVTSRLQYLFVDEFQDINSKQYKIFQAILGQGLTDVYAVGDQEQYILGFTNTGRAMQAFSKIPFNQFKNDADIEIIDTNYRSAPIIVDFLNRFRSDFKQTSTKEKLLIPGGVYYSMERDIVRVVNCFKAKVTTAFESSNHEPSCFYICYPQSIINQEAEILGLLPVASDGMPENKFVICEKILLHLFKKQKHELQYELGIDRLKLRVFSVRLLGLILSKPSVLYSVNNIEEVVLEATGIRIDDIESEEDRAFLKWRVGAVWNSEDSSALHRHSTAHKSKGLEADCVLVLCERKSVLENWLMSDPVGRANDITDSCRAGYVAFSRARYLIVIACLESMGDDIIAHLQDLGATEIIS